jgi:putative flavoprotein involved in K+ transport
LEPTTDLSPQARVDAWLADFEAALAVRDVERVVAKFAVDSFWRDLVAFTWNLKTVEGREGVADMLEHRLAETDRRDSGRARRRRRPVTSRRHSSSSRPLRGAASAICGSRVTKPGRC